MRPDHALGHARRPAGVDEELILRRAFDLERRAVALVGQRFIGEREIGGLAVVGHLHEILHLGQARPDLGDRVAEFRAIDDGLRIGIVEDVEHFFGLVAVVDVDMRQPRLEAGGQRLAIFRAVAHVERDLGSRLGAAKHQSAREIVGAPRRLAPCDHAIAMDQRRRAGRYHGRDRVQYVSKIPRHSCLPDRLPLGKHAPRSFASL